MYRRSSTSIPRAFYRQRASIAGIAAGACFLIGGCHPANTPTAPVSPAVGPSAATEANQDFLNRTTYDPWILTRNTEEAGPPAYLSDGQTGYLVDVDGKITQKLVAGKYARNVLVPQPIPPQPAGQVGTGQTLNLKTGALTTQTSAGPVVFNTAGFHPRDWVKLWNRSDVAVTGDPEAQQVVHAELYSLLSSTRSDAANSIPPLGLSSSTYQGHIFWDADAWMFPALVVQHPASARPIVDYRFQRLAQAKLDASQHGYAGAEFPWESAATGAETAPAEFAAERHITADVAFAAWQYYLWTADTQYLKSEGWPILQATADYWVSRVTRDPDGSVHIRKVLSPDETAGLVDDDSYTNSAARDNLRAAARAAAIVGEAADPRWLTTAAKIVIPTDAALGIPAENGSPLKDTWQAKQADTELVLFPLGDHYDGATAGKILDYYSAHVIKSGPAMTSGIHAVIAARLGRGAQALDFYRQSYRPFMRGAWDAFSEKRSTNNVYFETGTAASLNAVLYGFAGLRVVEAGEPAAGTRIGGDSVATLYADPHLPPGWSGLVIKGIVFRGKQCDMAVDSGNHVTITSESAVRTSAPPD